MTLLCAGTVLGAGDTTANISQDRCDPVLMDSPAGRRFVEKLKVLGKHREQVLDFSGVRVTSSPSPEG